MTGSSSQVYCSSFKRIYEEFEEIKAFMADIKSLFSKGMDTKKGLLVTVGSPAENPFTSSLRLGGSSLLTCPLPDPTFATSPPP